MPVYLAIKEIVRNRFRFITIVLIVALVTLLVIFLAAMGDGLAESAKEYIEAIDAELIVFQQDVDLALPASRLGTSKLNNIRRLDGVAAVGSIGFSTASIMLDRGGELERLDVTLVGVEPGLPGAPSVVKGVQLQDERTKEVVIDQHVLDRAKIPLGSTISIKVTQGAEEQFYELTVVGYTAGKKYNFLPSIFVPLRVWDEVRPKDQHAGGGEIVFTVAAVQLVNPAAEAQMAEVIANEVAKVEVTDPVTAYESIPGYGDMQATVTTQQNFALLIVLLIIGGFFQIQALQKIAQVGMLKAIGASNRLIALAVLVQVTLTTVLGLIVGGVGVGIVASFMPPGVPFVFDGQKIVVAVATLLIIGPLASLISIHTLLSVEPLKALGLGT
jgi:putative ABC transport system permease protein